MAREKGCNVSSLCRQLGYSKQAYYKWIQANKQRRNKREIVKSKVLSIRSTMPRIGTRKLYHLLKAGEGINIGRDKLFSLLREAGLLIVKKKRYTKTTDSRHWMHRFPDLRKELKLVRPEQLWVADITYLSLAHGYCYLHLITDGYSKKVVGYFVSANMAAENTLKALQMAISNREYSGALIHHSDRGLQYCSSLYVNVLEQNHIAISMTQDGSPYDNAVAERINGILKDEFGLDEIFETIDQVRLQTKQAIDIYNYQRPHLSNSLLTPGQMHDQNTLKPRLWHKKSTRTPESSCTFLPSPDII